MLSLALIHSMTYNSRRLEAVGYHLISPTTYREARTSSLSCPQFPVYVSPKDKEPSPDVTMADSSERGVYVDQPQTLRRFSSRSQPGQLLPL